MKKIKYVPAEFERAKPPVLSSVTYPTLFHYWGAPQWAYGALGFIIVIVWVLYVVWLFNAKEMEWPPKA